MPLKSKPLDFDITPEMPAEELRKAAFDYAKLHSKWYERQSILQGKLWNYLTLAIIVLSAISSIVAAYGPIGAWKLVPSALSAAAAFCAAYLTQFRVRDLWQIREVGRIDAEKLVARAQTISSNGGNSPFDDAIALKLSLHDLERDQNQQFFAIPRSTT
jgi:hypothetical protein